MFIYSTSYHISNLFICYYFSLCFLQVFTDNGKLCWRIQTQHVQILVYLLSTRQYRVSGFVQVLTALVNHGDTQSMLFKRNRPMVMEHFLNQYPKDALVLEKSAEHRYDNFFR